MKHNIVLFIAILLFVIIAAPITEANSFTPIPAGHTVYDSLNKLVDAGWIHYPVPFDERIQLSGYQIALLLIQAFEGISAEDVSIRSSQQIAMFESVIEELTDEELQLGSLLNDRNILQSFLAGLPLDTIRLVQSSFYQYLDSAAYGELLGLAAVFEKELFDLGFALTNIEIVLGEYQPILQNQFRLRISTDSSVHQRPASPFRLSTMGLYSQQTIGQYVLQFQDSFRSIYRPDTGVGKLATGHREASTNTLYIPTPQHDVFSAYRFIDFHDLAGMQ